MPKHRCACGSTFKGEPAAVKEHGGLCPPCFDLQQVLAFANSAGDTITVEEALVVIRGICTTRLTRARG